MRSTRMRNVKPNPKRQLEIRSTDANVEQAIVVCGLLTVPPLLMPQSEAPKQTRTAPDLVKKAAHAIFTGLRRSHEEVRCRPATSRHR